MRRSNIGPGIIGCIALIALCLGLFLLSSRHRAAPVIPRDVDNRPIPVRPADVDDRLVSADNRFAIKLFDQMAGKQPIQNIFISPFSISAALAMTYAGAAGTTQKGMSNALELQGIGTSDVGKGNLALAHALTSADPKVKIEIANSLWAKEGVSFQPKFVSGAQKYYDAKVSGLAGAPATINNWVEQKTHDKIRDLIARLDPSTVLVLVNAIYFKGEWTTKFDKSKTTNEDFHLPASGTKAVPMMWQEDGHQYFMGDDFEALKLPYGNRSMSMYFFLPDKHSSLMEFYKQLTVQNWDKWMSSFHETDVPIGIPRFKVEWGGDPDGILNQPLIAMGMGEAFASNADFMNMALFRPLYVDKVVHKASMQVDEEGTTAAAAPPVLMTKGGRGMRMPMLIDRPFFCAIRDDRTGEILFMGSIADPK
jgi:serpin B